MGILMGIGFQLVGLKSGFFIGLTIGMLNLIPYLGSILGVSVSLPLAYFQPDGGWLVLILVIAVMIAVQLIEGWILTPKIMGDQTGLHPVMIIFSVFFWGIALNGLLGMILAIPLSAFIVTFWRLARTKYVPLLLGHDNPLADDKPDPTNDAEPVGRRLKVGPFVQSDTSIYPMKRLITLLFFISTLVAYAQDKPPAVSSSKPNVVVIFADDLGYGDTSVYGATHVQTPNIDRLAHEGMRFTDGHAASLRCARPRAIVCSPASMPSEAITGLRYF